MAIDIAAFTPVEQFRAQVDETIDALKALPLAESARSLLIPGERGARTLDERLAGGIPLPAGLLKKLREQAEARAGPRLDQS